MKRHKDLETTQENLRDGKKSSIKKEKLVTIRKEHFKDQIGYQKAGFFKGVFENQTRLCMQLYAHQLNTVYFNHFIFNLRNIKLMTAEPSVSLQNLKWINAKKITHSIDNFQKRMLIAAIPNDKRIMTASNSRCVLTAL